MLHIYNLSNHILTYPIVIQESLGSGIVPPDPVAPDVSSTQPVKSTPPPGETSLPVEALEPIAEMTASYDQVK